MKFQGQFLHQVVLPLFTDGEVLDFRTPVDVAALPQGCSAGPEVGKFRITPENIEAVPHEQIGKGETEIRHDGHVIVDEYLYEFWQLAEIRFVVP